MQIGRDRRRALASWFFVGALFALCGVLGVLQYRWIGAVAVADRERLQDSLQASLNRLSQDFNSEISAACRAVLPVNGQAPNAEAAETAMIARYEQWRAAARHGPIFQQIAIAEFAKGQLVLRTLGPAGTAFHTEDWPENWTWLKERTEKMAQGLAGPGGPPAFDGAPDNEGTVFELPLFTTARPVPFARREIGWSIFELNLPYLRDVLLPELVQRYVAAGGNLEYQVEVMTRTSTPSVIYRPGGGDPSQVMANSDASVSLFANPFDLVMGRGIGGRGTSGGPGFGRWQMYVRHRAGSLEAVVAQARLRSVGVTSCVLLLMFGTLVAWIRFTRRSQRLAELQMDFVAGVSHELRTPLSVIHTAAYNLKGGVASDPAHVERYGALIHQESGRLKQMVEQVLRFSKAQAGHIVQEPGPVWMESVIADTLEAGGAAIQSGRCTVEQHIESGLPLILGDPAALEHALGNLISNAVKYGAAGGGWIGLFAGRVVERGRIWVEVRVVDRGPGIPANEQAHLFDPFFRGRRAQEDQVHGTGLGLSLVKKIVEAHGGTVWVKSEPGKGAEFIVRIPAAPPEKGHELAHSFSRG